MEKIKNIIISIFFVLFISIIFVLNLITKDQDISISERRKLEQFPKFTINNIINGTFFKKFDKYTTDQFIKRDDFRNIKANIQLKLRGNYNNLYIYNDYIIEQLYPLDIESVNNVADKINYIKNTYLKNNNILQTYIVSVNINSDDDLYDILNKYYDGDIFEKINEIKKYNNLKNIKDNTNINIIIDYKILNIFNKNLNDINLDSLIESKIIFIKNVNKTLHNVTMIDELNLIISSYNEKKKDSMYDFLEDDEKKKILNEYIEKLDNMIENLEENTIYKYGVDFVIPIKLN